MAYEVSTDGFCGPFDLLLSLIVSQEVDVYEVSLSRIVDAYLAEIDKMRELDLDVATEFLLIAAALVEYKCRSLLPAPERVDEVDELSLFEERDLLLSRLVECKTFAQAAQAITALELVASRSVARTAGPDERFDNLMPDLLEGVTVEAIRDAAEKALRAKPAPKVELSHVLVDELTVADVVDGLAKSLPAIGRVGFRELTRDLADRIEVIVHFLALLELYKQGSIELEQALSFGELTVQWCAPDSARPSDMLVEAEYRG